MRKISVVTLALILCAVLALPMAQADGAELILPGKVEAKETVVVSAPFGGTVESFTLRVGDTVQAGDALLTLDTAKITAVTDGTVRGGFAKVGDSAAYLQNKYGAMAYIEPAQEVYVEATTQNRYNSEENETIHIGETVYLQHTNSSGRTVPEGVGMIVGLTGQAYVVELTGGDLEDGDTAYIYRESDFDDESRIGRGTVKKVDPVVVQGEGTVLKVVAGTGTQVKRGDTIFEVVSGTLDDISNADSTVRAPIDGIVASVEAKAGQSAAKGQTLITLHAKDTMYLTTSVSEMDLAQLPVGTELEVVLDSLPDKTYEGRVALVSGVGQTSDQYTQYTVYVEFTPDADVLFGMSGTAYLR